MRMSCKKLDVRSILDSFRMNSSKPSKDTLFQLIAEKRSSMLSAFVDCLYETTLKKLDTMRNYGKELFVLTADIETLILND